MDQLRSSHVLIAALAVLLVGFYTIDISSDEASIGKLPDFTATTNVDSSENRPAPTLKDFNDAIVNIAEQAKSTVVTVNVTQTVEAPVNPFSRFFGEPEQREYQRQGMGSGVIVSKDGYILTNNHVVQNADQIEVTLYNDKRFDAEMIGTDPLTDIAVLKIDAPNLDVIKLGNSENLRVGEMVLAIGSPLGQRLAHSVSMGIISAKDRRIGILEERNAGYEKFIQTDAAINPGNSGGALVNMDGELVGINTAIASRSGGNEGIGFAVPIDLAKSIMTSLIEDGKVKRGYLGISLGGEVDRTMAKALDLDKEYGVIVGEVTEGSPADEAGLRQDDVILSYNGKPIKSWGEFRTAIGTSSPGTKIKLGINRDGKEQEITVTLGEMPEELMATRQQPESDRNMEKRLGFQVQELTPQIARQLELDPSQNGVVVTEVTRGSNAQQQGLQRGDVIIEVDRQPIEGVRDFRRAIQEIAQSDDNVVLLRILRDDSRQYIAFELN